MHKQIFHQKRNIILNESNIYLTNWIFFVNKFTTTDIGEQKNETSSISTMFIDMKQ